MPICCRSLVRGKLQLVCLDDSAVLVLSPFLLADVRVQVVVPSLPALLADPAWQLLRDVTPVLGSVFLD